MLAKNMIVYERIMRACRRGTGIRLNADEVWELASDTTAPVKVVHYEVSKGDSGACGHYPSPVVTVFTDEVTCPNCRMTEEWKERAAKPESRYASFNPYYVTEYDGPLPEGSLGSNGGFAVRRIFRTREQLERIPEKYFNLIRCPEAIDKAKHDLDGDPQAIQEGWTYEPWNNGRHILVEMSVQ